MATFANLSNVILFQYILNFPIEVERLEKLTKYRHRAISSDQFMQYTNLLFSLPIVAHTVNLTPLDEELEFVFSKIGRVLSLTRNPDNTAEIVMASEKEALAAIDKYNGSKLDGIPFKCALKAEKS